MFSRSCSAAIVLCLAASPWTSNADAVSDWNAATLACVQGPPNPPNRGGPPGLLDIALVQAAVHDAIQSIEGRYEPYHYSNPELLGNGSPAAAAAAATFHTLVGLYGTDDPCLAAVVDPSITYPGDAGLQAGLESAAAHLPRARPAVVLPTDPFLGGDEPGEWRPTPGVVQGTNTYVAHLIPFVMKRNAQYRPGPPPALSSKQYARDYDEVQRLGSLASAERSEDQTELARFWSANFVVQWWTTVRAIADANMPDSGDKARLFALVGFVSADSQISVYDAKYHYNLWRPITAIQEGEADGNPETVGEPAWTPFITNPAYPDYTSGANCLTGSITTMLQLVLGTDEVDFTVSSTAAGVTVNPRVYSRLSDAAQEVVEARILQGIHFRFADEVGRKQGAHIANRAFRALLKPVEAP